MLTSVRCRYGTSRQRIQALVRIQRAISSSLELDQVLGMITSYACELMSSPAASVFLLSEDQKSFIPRGTTGIPLTEESARPLSRLDSLAFRALHERRPVSISREKSVVARVLPHLDNGEVIAEIAAAPIETAGNPIGVIEVYNDRQRSYSYDELDTLNTFASAAAAAIANARIYEQAQAISRKLQESILAAQNDRQLVLTVLESIPDAIAVASPDLRIVQANEAARKVFRFKEGEESLSLSEIIDSTSMRTLAGELIGPEEHPLARALRGETVSNFNFTIAEADGKVHYRNASSAPVRDANGKIIYGVIIGRDVTQSRIARARLEEAYERERKIAQTLQQALLSAGPGSIDHVETAVKYEAGAREAEIGGDFFDIFSPEDGKTAIVIGDVEGKGLSAAVQIAAAKYGIRSYAYEDSSPVNVISRLNYSMYRDQTIAGFITIFYGVIDTKNCTISYVNGGHEPPLIRHGDGHVENLLSGGLIVGVEPDFPYEERSVDLHSGDRLLFYTDGITEARKEGGEMLGEDRLVDFWHTCTEESAEDLLDSVYKWAKGFSEGHFHDDVALVVVRVTD